MTKVLRVLCTIFGWLLVICNAAAETGSVIVNTQSGPVRGELLSTLFEANDYNSFKGIPYARPITKDGRFLPPKSVEPWTEPRDCSQFGPVCMQFTATGALIGSEDCLFLNVYTPAVSSFQSTDKGLPVMVFIHGGRFTHGSGNDDFYGPDFLLNNGVIVVTINYRLNVYGFLSFGTPKYSGNQGMKDQQLALKWIQANIAAFGGNPDNVTIFGQSAGSAACELHRMAPGSQGLFRQSIEMSGFFDVWSMFHHGKNFNVRSKDLPDFIKYLSQLDSKQLALAFPMVVFERQTVDTIKGYWYPVVESFDAEQPFLQFAPNHLIMMNNFTTDINVMTGYTNAEALSFGSRQISQSMLKNDFKPELPSISFDHSYSTQAYQSIARKIKDFYFPNGIDNSESSVELYTKMLSNIHQHYPIDKRVKMLAQQSFGQTFFYRFAMDSVLNYYKLKSNERGGQGGATHGDDICYLFYCKTISSVYSNITVDSLEYEQIKRMTKLYTDFAKSSNPGFPDVQIGLVQFLDITNEQSTVGLDPFKSEITFWQNLLNSHPEVLTLNLISDADDLIKQILNQYI